MPTDRHSQEGTRRGAQDFLCDYSCSLPSISHLIMRDFAIQVQIIPGREGEARWSDSKFNQAKEIRRVKATVFEIAGATSPWISSTLHVLRVAGNHPVSSSSVPGPPSPPGEGDLSTAMFQHHVSICLLRFPGITEVCIFVSDNNADLIVADLCTDKVYGKHYQIPAEE